MNEKSKERGEPGKIYHIRNVMGTEACGQTNALAHNIWTKYMLFAQLEMPYD